MTLRPPTTLRPHHAVVTGAAGAIGEALARAIRARWPRATLSLVDVSPRIDAVARELDGEALRWDLAKPDALEAEVGALVDAHGPIDMLINCAGVMEVRSLARTDWAVGDRLLAIDLTSPLRLMSLVSPAMIAARHGAIVNVSSMAGLTPIRGCAYYGAAKAGLAAASEIARLEMRSQGVRVVTVYPGPVRSELERRARAQVPSTGIARWLPTGDPVTLASRVMDAIAHDRARVVYPGAYALASRFPTVVAAITSALSPTPLDAALDGPVEDPVDGARGWQPARTV